MSDQIDVNQLSNALQQKVDLPSGKSQADIDYVIEYQLPTSSNNYTWYRLYKSGWIEQGGLATIPSRTNTGSSQVSVVFPVSMSDTNYIGFLDFQGGGNFYASSQLTFTAKSTSETKLEFYFNGTGTTASFPVSWKVEGMAAQS